MRSISGLARTIRDMFLICATSVRQSASQSASQKDRQTASQEDSQPARKTVNAFNLWLGPHNPRYVPHMRYVSKTVSQS
jgi:hypothetical protein